MRATTTRLRALALLAGGALALHQLHYLLEFGGDWRAAFGAPGHAYLSLVVPVVALALAAAATLFLAELAGWRSHRGDRSIDTPSLGLSWTAFALALAGVYLAQELLEGLYAGHPVALSETLGAHTWSAWALAVAIGGLLALLYCGAEAALALVPPGLRLRWIAPVVSARRALADAHPARNPLALHLSARAPPAT
jgi:hypothetical protein